MPNPKMGQPRLLNAELQKEIVDLLSTGVSIDDMTAHVGISSSAHYKWQQRGREELERVEQNPRARIRKAEQDYVDYFQAVKKARRAAKIASITVIQQAARGGRKLHTETIEKLDARGRVTERRVITKLQPPSWQAAAWYLERRYPAEYARTIRNEIVGGDEGKAKPVIGIDVHGPDGQTDDGKQLN